MGDLSEHFSSVEFTCKCKQKGCKPVDGYCGGKVWIEPELIRKLEKLRDMFKSPIHVHSGCRCSKYNRYVGGASSSQHLKGTAADIAIEGVEPEYVADAAEELGFGGVGRYDTFTHVDIRSGKARWDSRKGVVR